MARIDVGLSMLSVVLEEFLAGFRMADAAEDTKFREVQIADGGAVVSAVRERINLD